MKMDENEWQDMANLERDIGALFDATAPGTEDIRMGRIAARAAEGKRRPLWAIRFAAIGLTCAAIVAGVIVVGGDESKTAPSAADEKVEQTQVTQASPETVLRDEEVVVEKSFTPSQRRLAPEIDDLGEGVNDEQVRLAMGTYLDLDLDGDDLDFEDWDGGSEGLSEEELLRVTKDLLRNGS